MKRITLTLLAVACFFFTQSVFAQGYKIGIANMHVSSETLNLPEDQEILLSYHLVNQGDSSIVVTEENPLAIDIFYFLKGDTALPSILVTHNIEPGEYFPNSTLYPDGPYKTYLQSQDVRYRGGGNVVVVWPGGQEVVPTDTVLIFVSVIDTITGRQGGKVKHKLVAYPNPTNQELNFDTDALIKQMRIFGKDGKHIVTVYKPKNIDISEMPDGLYFINAEFMNGEIHVLKFIIHR